MSRKWETKCHSCDNMGIAAILNTPGPGGTVVRKPVCANCFVMASIRGKLGKLVASEGPCVICKALGGSIPSLKHGGAGKIVEYKFDFARTEIEYSCCVEHMKAIADLNLRPNEVKALQGLFGVTFNTHDDFYDEDGNAVQPRSKRKGS